MSGGSRSNPVGDSGFGSPAFGQQEMAALDLAASSDKNGYMRSGPREQLSPMLSGRTCSTAFQSASTVCAEIIVSPPRPTAAEIMTGSDLPSASNTSWIATSAALAFNESKM